MRAFSNLLFRIAPSPGVMSAPLPLVHRGYEQADCSSPCPSYPRSRPNATNMVVKPCPTKDNA